MTPQPWNGHHEPKAGFYLSSVIHVLLADETLLDPCRALVANGDVAAGQEEDVPLLVGANDALVETLFVVVAVVVRRPRVVGHQILGLAEKSSHG